LELKGLLTYLLTYLCVDFSRIVASNSARDDVTN